MYTTTVNNSTNINKTNNYLSPSIIEDVENCLLSLAKQFFFHFKYIKYLSGLSVLEVAMQAVNLFQNKYRC